jgi:acetyl-CoA carboxylase biotin carboxylase subunit
MHRALLELTVVGVETSREFHLRVLEDGEFRAGAIDIQWLERRLPSLLNAAPTTNELHTAAIASALIADAERTRRSRGSTGSTSNGSRSAVAAPVTAPVASGRDAATASASAWAQLARLESLRDR